jgi:hypothetical protein
VARFIEEVLTQVGRKLADSLEGYEKRPARSSSVSGRFCSGDPQERGRTHGGIGLLSLPPRILQKIVCHGVSLRPLAYS